MRTTLGTTPGITMGMTMDTHTATKTGMATANRRPMGTPLPRASTCHPAC